MSSTTYSTLSVAPDNTAAASAPSWTGQSVPSAQSVAMRFGTPAAIVNSTGGSESGDLYGLPGTATTSASAFPTHIAARQDLYNTSNSTTKADCGQTELYAKGFAALVSAAGDYSIQHPEEQLLNQTLVGIGSALHTDASVEELSSAIRNVANLPDYTNSTVNLATEYGVDALKKWANETTEIDPACIR